MGGETLHEATRCWPEGQSLNLDRSPTLGECSQWLTG